MSNSLDLEYFKNELISELLSLFGDFLYIEPSERFIYEYGDTEDDYVDFTNYLIEINEMMRIHEFGNLYIVSLAYTQVKLGIEYKEFRDKALSIFNEMLEDGLDGSMKKGTISKIKKVLSIKKVTKAQIKKSVMNTVKKGNIYAFQMKPNKYNKLTESHFLYDKYIVFKVIDFDKFKTPVIVMYNRFFDDIPAFEDVQNCSDILLYQTYYVKIMYGEQYPIYGVAPGLFCITGQEKDFWVNEVRYIGNETVDIRLNTVYNVENEYWLKTKDQNDFWTRNDGFGGCFVEAYDQAIKGSNQDLDNNRIQMYNKEKFKTINDGIYSDYIDILTK